MKRILIILLAVVFLTTVFKIVPIDDGNHVTSHIQGEEQANVIVLSETSFGYMVHFAIADQSGRSVVVEYVNNEMLVTETPAVTNFYLSEGEKNGIGIQQSHERYELLINRLKDSETMEMNDVRDALDSVSKDNFGEFEATEWSIVMNQTTGEVRYYHREDYNTAYTFMVTGGQES